MDTSIALLIALLGSTSFPVREAATLALPQYGLAALPALQSASDHPDAEIAWRAKVALLTIEQAALEEHDQRLCRGAAKLPYIDSAPWNSERDKMVGEYRERAIAAGVPLLPRPGMWPAHRYATWLWMQDRIAAHDAIGMVPALAIMAQRTACYDVWAMWERPD